MIVVPFCKLKIAELFSSTTEEGRSPSVSLSFERHTWQLLELAELVLVVYFVFPTVLLFTRSLIASTALHTLPAESYTCKTSKVLIIEVQLFNGLYDIHRKLFIRVYFTTYEQWLRSNVMLYLTDGHILVFYTHVVMMLVHHTLAVIFNVTYSFSLLFPLVRGDTIFQYFPVMNSLPFFQICIHIR